MFTCFWTIKWFIGLCRREPVTPLHEKGGGGIEKNQILKILRTKKRIETDLSVHSSYQKWNKTNKPRTEFTRMHSNYIKRTQYWILGERFSRLKNKAPSFSTKLPQHQEPGITETITSATDASETQPRQHWQSLSLLLLPPAPGKPRAPLTASRSRARNWSAKETGIWVLTYSLGKRKKGESNWTKVSNRISSSERKRRD